MNNEEKILKMLGGLTETVNALTHTVSEIQTSQNKMHSELSENTKAIIKLESKIESEISDKIRGLYDTREITNGNLEVIDSKLNDIKIDINNISIKTIQNDSQIIRLVENQK